MVLARTVLTAAAATAVAAAGIEDVEHVVIFMQENRPFDHYYGMLQGVRGFNDPAAPLLPNGDPVWKQPLSVQPATARFCGCSACDLVWLQKGSEAQSMFDTFSCPTLADYASGGKPPVPITQGELCLQVVKDLLTTDFEDLRIADFLSPTSTHSAARAVQHAQFSTHSAARSAALSAAARSGTPSDTSAPPALTEVQVCLSALTDSASRSHWLSVM